MKTVRTTKANEQADGKSTTLTPVGVVFGILLVMSTGMMIREMKVYNSQYWTSITENLDYLSMAPTAYLSWSTETLSDERPSESASTITKTNAPPAFKKYDKVLGWIWEKNETDAASNTDTISVVKTKPSPKEDIPITQPTTSGGSVSAAPTITNAKTPVGANETIPFKRYEKVVIATKIHGPHQWLLVEQSLCLLHFAYNHKVHYDIIIFSTLEVPKEKVEDLEKMIGPAKIKLVVDNIGFQEEIAALPKAKKDLFLKRCSVNDPANLTWWSECRERSLSGKRHRLAYNWQAEFRSTRVWEHPALAEYKYMMWLDSDGFPSREWKNDPIGYFIEKKGVVMFDNFPQGSNKQFNQDIIKSFNGSLVCDLHLNKEKGHLERKLIHQEQFDVVRTGKNPNNVTVPCTDFRVHLIHGFMHITDLDFFRQPKIIEGLKALQGDCFLCRSPDDQLAVTIGPAIYEPEKTFDMRSHGFDLKVFHNFALDGHEKPKPPGFVKYWNQVASKEFPTAAKVCKVTQRDR